MDSDPTEPGKLTPEEAKQRLVQQAPAPLDVFLYDPLEIIRRHPREAVAVAAAVGVLLAASTRIRRSWFDGALATARFFLK